MNEAAKVSGATILSSHKHFFEPHGVSAVVIISESNLCIHTWPEFGYAAADFFTCGDTVDPWKSFEYLKTFLKAKKFNCMELQRGNSQLVNDPSFSRSAAQNAIQVVGTDDCIEATNQVINVQVPEGHLAITDFDTNNDMDQTVTSIAKPIVCKQSPFQKVQIADHKWWGKCMWVDGVPNVCERDEFIYHELIVHVPMMVHPNPTRVLIIGGGDGGSARELLRHPNLTNATMIDIDEEIVKLCKEHMPSINRGAYDNPNLNLIIGDGIEHVKNAADNSYDVIIVDSTDPLPDSVGECLFTKEFYENCYRILARDGTISTQALMPMRYDNDTYRRSLSNIQSAFGKDNTYIYFAPTDFYQGMTSLCLCRKDNSMNPKIINKERVKSFSSE